MKAVRNLRLFIVTGMALALIVGFSGCSGNDGPSAPLSHRPSSPSPANNAIEVRPDDTLRWSYTPNDPEVAPLFDVYFGTGSTLILAGSDLDCTMFVPPLPWEDNTTYRWQVIAREGEMEYSGSTWKFSTIFGGTWTQSYPVSAPAPQLYRAVELNDGSLIVSGASVIDENQSDLLLMKLDEEGTLQWDSLYGELRLASDMALEGNDVVLVGHLGRRGVALKLDEDGDSLWSRSYGTATSQFSSVVIPSGGGYLFGGTHYVSGSSDFWVVRTDDEGTVVFNRTYDGGGVDTLLSLVETSDGAFAFSGVTDGQGYVARISAIGALTWDYTGSEDDPAISLVQDSEGTLTVLEMPGNGSTFTPRLRVHQYPGGESSYTVDLPGSSPYARGEIIADDDGGVAVVYTALSDFNGGDGPTEAMRLVRVLPGGSILWIEDYEPLSPTRGEGVLQLAEGNYLIVGSRYSAQAMDIEPFVVKTTYNGSQHPQ